MARFKGKTATRPDRFVPGALGVAFAVGLIVALLLLIWFLVDRNAFTHHFGIAWVLYHAVSG